MPEWWESGFFENEVGRFLFTDTKWREAQNEVNFMTDILELQDKGKVLDLCCGVGRHAIFFAQAGYDVVGLDISQTYLEKAKQKAEKCGHDIHLINGDMREIPYENEFDAVINVFTSFGYFRDHEENQKVLDAVYKSLKPGGRFVMEMMNRDYFIRNYQESSWAEIDEGYILEERNFDPYHDILYNRWIIIKEDIETEFDFSHYLYSAGTLNRMLHQAGFFVEEFYGGLNGSPLTPQSQRLCVLSLKKPNL